MGKTSGLNNLNDLFLGALSHADDIQTLSTKLSDCIVPGLKPGAVWGGGNAMDKKFRGMRL